MTDHANELRRYARKIAHPAGDVPSVMLAAAEEIERLAARLEATEEDRSNFLVEMGKLCAQCDTLRAKIEQMERQEPVAKVRVHQTGGNAGIAWSVAPLNDFDALPLMRDGSKLYALPGAQTQGEGK